VTNLVYFERHGSVMTAIRREKERKAWRREEKIRLIESTNQKWKDLSYGWYQRHQFQPDRKAIELKRRRASSCENEKTFK